jgi:transketolase
MKYEDLLADLAQRDDTLVVLTAENRSAIRNLPPKLGARFIDFGISEMTMIGAAAGLALRGRKPVAHALATFLTLRPFEFIRTDVGIPGLDVKLVGAVPGFLSEANGPTHQSLEDVSIMRGVPNMQVFCPSDEVELVEGMKAIMASPKPCYVRYCALPASVVHKTPFEIGKAEVLTEGNEITLLTYGFLVREAMEAEKILRAAGKSVRVVNMRMLKPVDEKQIVRAAEESELLVTIEDHFQTGGLYTIVAETLLKERKTAKVLPIALEERWFKPALLEAVLEHEGFKGRQIAERILKEERS